MMPDLEVLLCQRCRAPVALVDAPTAPCSHCDAEVEIPAVHAEALRATREGHEARTKASERLEALGAPGRGGGGLIVAYLAMIVLPSISVYFAAQSSILSLSKLERMSMRGCLPYSLELDYFFGLRLPTARAGASAMRSRQPLRSQKRTTSLVAAAEPLSQHPKRDTWFVAPTV